MTALHCPQCGSRELATTEHLSGSAHGYARVDKDGEREFIHRGWTEVWWDSSETVGIECQDCDWRCTDGDYMERLA